MTEKQDYEAGRAESRSQLCEELAATYESLGQVFLKVVAEIDEVAMACASKTHSLELLSICYMASRISIEAILELDARGDFPGRLSDAEFSREMTKAVDALGRLDQALLSRIDDRSPRARFGEMQLTARQTSEVNHDSSLDQLPDLVEIVKQKGSLAVHAEYGHLNFDFLDLMGFLAHNEKNPAELEDTKVAAYLEASMRNKIERESTRETIEQRKLVNLEVAQAEMGQAVRPESPYVKSRVNATDVNLDLQRALEGARVKLKHREIILAAVQKGLGLRSAEAAEYLGFDQLELDAARKSLERRPRVRKRLAAYKPSNPRH
jgi:hypothetical protein